MRRALAAGAVCALAILGVTAAAPAPHHAPARCLAHYDWSTGTHFPALERYGQMDWESQCSPEIGAQLRIGCKDFVTGQLYNAESGTVYELEVNNETHCGPTDAALFLAIRFNGGPWKTLCSPCSGWRRDRARLAR